MITDRNSVTITLAGQTICVTGQITGKFEQVKESNSSFSVTQWLPSLGCWTITKKGKLFGLHSPRVEFEGWARAEGDADFVRTWELGFIQNMYGCLREAQYPHNVTRRLRQNTMRGPVRDGDEGRFVWYENDREGKQSLGKDTRVDVKISDEPNWQTPVNYNGSPVALKKACDGELHLEATAGGDQFKTFLAVVHEQSKSIAILGAISWSIDWRGRFRHLGPDQYQFAGADPMVVMTSVPLETRVYDQLNTKHTHHCHSARMPIVRTTTWRLKSDMTSGCRATISASTEIRQ